MIKKFDQYEVVVDLIPGVDMNKVEEVMKSKLGPMDGEIELKSLTGIKVEEWNKKRITMVWTMRDEDPEPTIENIMYYATDGEELGFYEYDYLGEVEIEI